jgi:hypothetical protein
MWYMAKINHAAIEFDHRPHIELHFKVNGT